MNPLLLDIPEQFETERLTLRAPHFGDAAFVYPAIVESAERLAPWMPWMHPIPTFEEEEAILREGRVKYLAREALWLLFFLKGTDMLVGSSGLQGIAGSPKIDWSVPKFEIGYWVRTQFEGQGYVCEAVEGVTRFAFDVLGAERVEIRMDDRNRRSWRVAERAGYQLDGTLRNDERDVQGKLRDTRIYSMIRQVPEG